MKLNLTHISLFLVLVLFLGQIHPTLQANEKSKSDKKSKKVKTFLKVDLQDEKFGSFETSEEIHYFEVSLPNLIEAKILLLTAKGITPDSEPEMFVSYKEKAIPKDLESSEYHSKPSALSILYIDDKQLKEHDSYTYRVGIKCTQDCHYKFTAFYEKDITLDMNSQRYILITEEEQAVQINVEKNNYTNFIAEFELMNPFEVKHTFDAYFNWDKNGKKVHKPKKGNSKRKGEGWGSGNGQGLLILKDDEICDKCIILTNIKAEKGSIIRVNTYSYSGFRQVEPFEIINDFNQPHSKKIFNLELDENAYHFNPQKIDFVVSLVMFQGDADLYVHENKCPDEKEDFEYSSNLFGDDRIVISPSRRQKKTNRYCIMTTAEEFSLFSLNIYPLATKKLELPFDYPESGIVLPQQIINYKLTIRGEAQEPFKISIKLTNIVGKPYLYVKQCDTPTEFCEVTQEEIDKKDEKNSTIKHTVDTYTAQIEFIHDQSLCHTPDLFQDTVQDQNINHCTYVIAVQGIEKENQSTYTIMASHDYYHTTLVENHPYHDYLEVGQINYYKFDLKHIDEVNQLKFEVTGLEGQVTIFTSSDIKYPDINNKDKIDFTNVITYSSSEYEDEKLPQGVYYLGVQGDHSVNSYTVTVSVEKKDGSAESFYKLSQDTKQEITIKTSEKAYFKFKPLAEHDQDVQVQVERLKGKFHFYIATEKNLLPSSWKGDISTKGVWASHHKQIVIQADDIREETGILYGVIFPNLDGGIQGEDLYKCSVVYHQGNVKTLKLNEMNTFYMPEEEMFYYRISLHEHDSITLTKKISTFDQSVLHVEYFISDQAHLTSYPTKTSEQMKDFEPLIISEKDIKALCPSLSKNQNGLFTNKCYIYMTVFTVESGMVSLYATKNTSQLLLFPNVSQHITLPKISSNKVSSIYMRQIYMFVYPNTPHIEITLDNYHAKNPKIRYAFQDLSEFSNDRSAWKWPSEDDKNIAEEKKNHYSERLYTYLIDSKHFKDCAKSQTLIQSQCVLLLEVFEEYTQEPEKIPAVELTLSTGQKILTEGFPVKSTLPKDGINTFEFQIFEENAEEIIIEATVQTKGKIEILVEKLEFDPEFTQNPQQFPTNPEIFWKATPEYPHISIKKSESSPDLRGTYSIQVLALDDVHYSISYRFGGYDQVQYIIPGYPQQFTLERQQSISLVYDPSDIMGFKLLISQIRGDAKVSALVFDQQNQDSYGQDTPFLWYSHEESYYNILEVTEQEHKEACKDLEKCVVGLKIWSSQYSRLSLILQDFTNISIRLSPSVPVVQTLLRQDTQGIIITDDRELQLSVRVFKGAVKVTYYQGNSGQQLSKQVTEGLKPTLIDLQAISFDHRMVVIEGLSSSVYELHTIPSEGSNSLVFGIPQMIKFKNQSEIRELMIANNPDEFSGEIEVAIQHEFLLKHRRKSYDKILDQLLKVEFFFEGFNDQRQKLGVDKALQFNENLIFKLPPVEQKGHIIIKAQIQQNDYTEFYITATEQGQSSVLIPDFERRGMGDKGDQNIYQLMVPKNEYVVLEQNYCQGSGIATAASKKEFLEDGTFDLSLQQLTSFRSIKYDMLSQTKNDIQNVYVSMSVNTDNTIYSITPFYFHTSQYVTPFEVVEQLKEEPIKYTYNKTSEIIQLKVSALYADYDKLINAGWEILSDNYQLFYGSNEHNLESISMCNTRLGEQVSLEEYKFQEKKYGYDKDQPKQLYAEFAISTLDLSELLGVKEAEVLSESFYVKILAQIHMNNKKTNQLQTFKFPYEVKKVDFASQQEEGISIWAILSMIFGAGVILYFVNKAFCKFSFKRSPSPSDSYGTLQTSQSFVEMKG